MDYLSKYFKPIAIILGLIVISELGFIGFKDDERATPQKLINKITNVDTKTQTLCKAAFVTRQQCEEMHEALMKKLEDIRAAKGDRKILIAISKQTETLLSAMEHHASLVDDLFKQLDACQHLPIGHPDRPPPGTCAAILGTTTLSVF